MKNSRREFLKYSTCGLSAIALGPSILSCDNSSGRLSSGLADPTVVNVGMTTADVEMVDGRRVFHWLFGADMGTTISPSFPGPIIFHFEDEPLRINIRNTIQDGVPRSFAIVGPPSGISPYPLLKSSAPIPFGSRGTFELEPFEIPAGSYLYKDPSLDPLSRVMGLHGVLIVLPAAAKNPVFASTFPKPTPYTNPSPNVQMLFNDLGVGVQNDPNAVFPGQPWFPTKDANPFYDPVNNGSDHEHFLHFREMPNGPKSGVLETFFYRNRIWLHSQVDPDLNARVAAGFLPEPVTVRPNFQPQYFTLNGRSGATSSHSPDITPIGTVGDPHVIRLINAGLTVHSPHIHANHVYVLSVNNVQGSLASRAPTGDGLLNSDVLAPDNVIILDTVHLEPQDRVDWLLPFIRPPDIPMILEDNTLFRPGQVTDKLLLTLTELTQEERHMVLITPQTPLSYPMHCHLEPAQTAAGGNYPQGQVAVWEIHGEFGLMYESIPIRESSLKAR